jgi:hypothetical protein
MIYYTCRWLAAYKISSQCEGKTREAKKDILAGRWISIWSLLVEFNLEMDGCM